MSTPVSHTFVSTICKISARPAVYIYVRGSEASEKDLLSDQQIVDLVKEGKVDAFGQLVARYEKPVFRLAWSMLTNWNDAEDAAQEAFIRAYRNLSRYREMRTFWAWLRRITVNVCLNRARPASLASLEEIDESRCCVGDPVCEAVMSAEEGRDLRRMVHELPYPYRSVLVLKYLEGMSYAEIAEALDETLSNVQVRIHRAKKMLRQRMKVCAE